MLPAVTGLLKPSVMSGPGDVLRAGDGERRRGARVPARPDPGEDLPGMHVRDRDSGTVDVPGVAAADEVGIRCRAEVQVELADHGEAGGRDLYGHAGRAPGDAWEHRAELPLARAGPGQDHAGRHAQGHGEASHSVAPFPGGNR